MSTESVASRPPKKPSLTLANLVLIRKIGQDTRRISGTELARLIDGMDADVGGPLVDPDTIAQDLLGLSEVLFALQEADSGPASALGFVSDALRRLARRVLALEPCENRKATSYQVEVTQ